jgi:hypothetical protein
VLSLYPTDLAYSHYERYTRTNGWPGARWDVRPKRRLPFCHTRVWPHSGNVSNAAPYLEPKGESGQEHGVKSPLKLQSQKSEGGQQGRLWLRQDCLNPNRGGTRASPGNGTIAQV